MAEGTDRILFYWILEFLPADSSDVF